MFHIHMEILITSSNMDKTKTEQTTKISKFTNCLKTDSALKA